MQVHYNECIQVDYSIVHCPYICLCHRSCCLYGDKNISLYLWKLNIFYFLPEYSVRPFYGLRYLLFLFWCLGHSKGENSLLSLTFVISELPHWWHSCHYFSNYVENVIISTFTVLRFSLFGTMIIMQIRKNIWDWIWENLCPTHSYKYLEILILCIWSIIACKGKQMLA